MSVPFCCPLFFGQPGPGSSPPLSESTVEVHQLFQGMFKTWIYSELWSSNGWSDSSSLFPEKWLGLWGLASLRGEDNSRFCPEWKNYFFLTFFFFNLQFGYCIEKKERGWRKSSRIRKIKSDRVAREHNCRTLVPLFPWVWKGGNMGHLLP